MHHSFIIAFLFFISHFSDFPENVFGTFSGFYFVPVLISLFDCQNNCPFLNILLSVNYLSITFFISCYVIYPSPSLIISCVKTYINTQIESHFSSYTNFTSSLKDFDFKSL